MLVNPRPHPGQAGALGAEAVPGGSKRGREGFKEEGNTSKDKGCLGVQGEGSVVLTLFAALGPVLSHL